MIVESKLYKALNEEYLDESIEKHDTLNPKLFNEDNTMKKEVLDKLNEIAQTFIDTAKENGIELDVKDILVVGSNANYNYTNDSDIDLHIIVSRKPQCNKKEHLDIIYQLFKSKFNDKYDLTIYGIPVELYIEFEDEDVIETPTEEVIDEELYTISEGDDMELFEMAYSKNQIKNKLLDNLENILIHLMCCYIFKNSTNNLNHWKNEIFGFLHVTYKWTKTNKFLPEKEIEAILLGWEDAFYNHLSSNLDEIKIKENTDDLPQFDKNKLFNFMKNYLKWVSEELAKKGELSLDSVKSKIDELMKED